MRKKRNTKKYYIFLDIYETGFVKCCKKISICYLRALEKHHSYLYKTI